METIKILKQFLNSSFHERKINANIRYSFVACNRIKEF